MTDSEFQALLSSTQSAPYQIAGNTESPLPALSKEEESWPLIHRFAQRRFVSI
jgi:hypothetical protein